LAERLRKSTHEAGAVTVTQYLLARFGSNSSAIRIISVAIITAAMLGYVAAQMNAAGKAFDAVFHLPYSYGVLIGAAIILTYTVTGGFRAICWTDVIQAGFMVVALIGMPIITLAHLGGIGNVYSTLQSSSPELLSFSGGRAGYALIGFVVGMFGIGFGYPGQPQILARFMAARDRETIRRGGIIAFIWFFLVYVGAILFGLLARAYYGALADAEQALPLACGELLPPILGVFVIAAIVSAICSTADSQLIVVSSALSRDVFLRGNSTDSSNREAGSRFLRLDRIMLVALGLISVYFALQESRLIFSFVLYAWAVLGAAFGPVVILGLMWKRTTKAGAISGMLVGTVVAVFWREVDVLSAALYELVPAFLLSLVAVYLVSLVTSVGRKGTE
jgi:sodium/proline symporter